MADNEKPTYPDSLGGLVVSFSEGKFGAENERKYVCENGIFESDYWGKERVILWDDIDAIFLNATKNTLNYLIPIGEKMGLRICSIDGDEISFDLDATFRIGGKDKEKFFAVYQFIISKTEARQWEKLISDFEAGLNVSFHEFEITQEAICRKTKVAFGGSDVVKLQSIVGCGYTGGGFIIEFANDKGRVKQKYIGSVECIPNIHLAERLLMDIAWRNLAEKEKQKGK